MSQENEYDIRDQRKILILEMSTNPGGEVVTQILLHSVMYERLAGIPTVHSPGSVKRYRMQFGPLVY